MEVTEKIHAFIWHSPSANNCNTYLLDDTVRILIDPGHIRHFQHVQAGLDELGLSTEDIDLVLCTHAHLDHLEAVRILADAKFAVHEAGWQAGEPVDRPMNPRQGQGAGLPIPALFLTEGSLSVRGLDLEIIHTPGHSPESISIYWPAQKALFTGDLIFRDGVGRTDLPGGNGKQLKAGIKRVSELDSDHLLSGHGDIISGRDEVQSNFRGVEERWFPYV